MPDTVPVAVSGVSATREVGELDGLLELVGGRMEGLGGWVGWFH